MKNELKIDSPGFVEEGCSRLGRLLGLEKPVQSRVLFGAIEDDAYAHNLFACKKTPEFLEHLLQNPPPALNGGFSGLEVLGEQMLQRAKKMLEDWQSLENIREYHRRFQEYLDEDQRKNPSSKPCGCGAVKPDIFREVYLDHNATTEIRPEVKAFLKAYDSGEFGFANPSSSTVQGYEASKLILEARRKIAGCLDVKAEEIAFTGGGTEANNLAIKGIAFKHLDKKGHLVTSKVEHASVLNTMRYLETLGFAVTYLDTDRTGRVSPEAVGEALREDTFLVSIMAANNEIGTINPIEEIGRLCREKEIALMVDAVQAFGKIPLSPKAMGISLLTFSGHKLYAPKGIGGIYIEEGLELVPLLHGGGQENGRRPGTEAVGAIMALGEAAYLAHHEMEAEVDRLKKLVDFFLQALKEIEPEYIINGALKERLPGNIHIGFPHVDSGALLKNLNRVGICVSAGSACSSKKLLNSHVLEAIGADTKNYASIRFSLGLGTSKEDIEYLVYYLKKILEKIKRK